MMIQKEQLLKEAYDLRNHLLRFLRHPLQEIQSLPDWQWEKVLVFHALISIVTSILASFLSKKILLGLLFSIIVSPILTLITMTIVTLFFYYAIQIFFKRTVSGRKMFTLLAFATIPFFIFQIISEIFPPITLFSVAFTAALLIIGFVVHFSMPKKTAIQLVGGLYLLIFLVWISFQITSSQRFDRSWSPDRIEAPEVELGQ